jgi:hypothetical protein
MSDTLLQAKKRSLGFRIVRITVNYIVGLSNQLEIMLVSLLHMFNDLSAHPTGQ